MDLLKEFKKDILKSSSPAVCGIMEREITVKKENVSAVKKMLKSKGQFIVGTSEKGEKTRKIWFSPSVSL